MVNTVVTFGNNRFSPSNSQIPVTINIDKRSILQRRIYLTISILLIVVTLIPNILFIKHEYDDFTYNLIFIFHGSFLIVFFISTAIYRNIGDGIATISALVLFAIYKTVHYLIQYRYCTRNFRIDFFISTIQLTIVLIFTIGFVLWTYFLIQNKYRIKKLETFKHFQQNQKRIFYSLLNFNFMLMITTLIFHIYEPTNFGLSQILTLSIGIPLALVWCTLGILMSMFKNCLCMTGFYFFSIIQPLHLIYLSFEPINKLSSSKSNDDINKYLSISIIKIICISTNMFVHLFTTITACWMVSKTDKTIFNTQWMVTDI